jgi:hypothetical protein
MAMHHDTGYKELFSHPEFVQQLIEFQSSVDPSMPLRMLHYVACFYQHLLKTKGARLAPRAAPEAV